MNSNNINNNNNVNMQITAINPCTSIAHLLHIYCQRTSLLIGAVHQAIIPAAMHEFPGGRGLLMREWLAMAAHCNCHLCNLAFNTRRCQSWAEYGTAIA